MKQYNTIKAEVESWRDFSRHLQDTLELAQLDDEGRVPNWSQKFLASKLNSRNDPSRPCFPASMIATQPSLPFTPAREEQIPGLGRNAGAHVLALGGGTGL